ncbi:MAG: flavodoxin [Candidatus Avoscillospira sp.]
MNSIAIVYWSGTGNTEQMAFAVEEGVRRAGGRAVLLQPGEFDADRLGTFDAVAFGCPAMGAEELEEGEFTPMFEDLEDGLSGRRVALFGSYGWGDGQWMRDWADRCRSHGAELLQPEGLIANEAPDEAALDACRALGEELARW